MSREVMCLLRATLSITFVFRRSLYHKTLSSSLPAVLPWLGGSGPAGARFSGPSLYARFQRNRFADRKGGFARSLHAGHGDLLSLWLSAQREHIRVQHGLSVDLDRSPQMAQTKDLIVGQALK